MTPLLSIRLSARYGQKEVLRDVSLDLAEGEIAGLVGQSGSGKSTLALSLLRLLNFKGGEVAGSICLRGRELMDAGAKEMRTIRGREIALVSQNAHAALNPALSVGAQLREAWKAHSKAPWQDARRWIEDLFAGVDLPCEDEFLRRLPRQLSSGQAQRVLIAMALLHRPALVIADEPTSALDLLTQAEVLKLLERVNQEYSTAILCISHDLLSLATLCHRVAILHEGSVVETGTPQEVFAKPSHPHTRALVAALPRPSSFSGHWQVPEFTPRR